MYRDHVQRFLGASTRALHGSTDWGGGGGGGFLGGTLNPKPFGGLWLKPEGRGWAAVEHHAARLEVGFGFRA